MTRKKIACLVQTHQHYTKMLDIRAALGDRYDVQIVLDDIIFPQAPKLLSSESVLLSSYASGADPAQKQNKLMFKRHRAALYAETAGMMLLNARRFVVEHNPLPRYYSGCIGRAIETLISTKLVVQISSYFKLSQLPVLIYLAQMRRIERYIKRESPDMLIMAEANVQHLSQAYVRLFAKAGIPSVVAPYTFCSPSEPALYYYDSPGHRFFPWLQVKDKWVYHYKGRDLIRIPIYLINAMEALKIEPPQPWVQESSDADKILVESHAMLCHYRNLGFPEDQLALIGDIAHDALYTAHGHRDALKGLIHDELGFENKRDYVVFSLYPDCTLQKHGGLEFASYQDSIRYICQKLSTLHNYNIILCLHPSLKEENFHHLENDRIKISTRPTIDLIAVSDLYVACISATIRWAISLGIPVINYDVYKFDYNDYASVPGVLNVNRCADFDRIIDRINTDQDYLPVLAGSQRAVFADWGVIDGKFKERLRNLVDQLIELRTTEKRQKAIP